MTNRITDALLPSKRPPGYSPVASMLMSFFIPGAGQVYKGQPIWGAMLFVFVLAGYICLILPGIVLHLMVIVDAGWN